MLLHQEGIFFYAEYQHFRCFAHIINLRVQNILKAITKLSEEDDFNNKDGYGIKIISEKSLHNSIETILEIH